jgi:hypothetical protein
MWKLVVIIAVTAATFSGMPSAPTTNPPRSLDPVHGGTVAFLRTPTEIAIAADSLAVAPDDPSTTRSACKIFQIARSNLFIAGAGLDPEAVGGLNQIALINRAHLSNKTILATANAFAQAVRSPLVLELQRLKSDSEVNFARAFEGKAVIAMIFCGFEKRVSVVYQREFIAYTAQDGKISIRVDSMDCPGPLCAAEGIGGNILGERNLASGAIKPGGFSFDAAGEAAPAVRRLVQQQIDDQSNSRDPKARGPIDVLQITTLRATWVEHKERCAVIFPYWRNGLDGTGN